MKRTVIFRILAAVMALTLAVIGIDASIWLLPPVPPA